MNFFILVKSIDFILIKRYNLEEKMEFYKKCINLYKEEKLIESIKIIEILLKDGNDIEARRKGKSFLSTLKNLYK